MTNMLQSFVDNIFGPELMRRQENGELPKPFSLHAAQCIMRKGSGESEIRFNDDCKFTILTDNPQEHVDRSKLTKESNISFDLHPEDDGNAGHISMILLADGTWGGGFSCIYNREASRAHLLAADEFTEAAIYSLEREHLRAYVDNMFSATELVSKAYILTDLPPDFASGGGSHKMISSMVNIETMMGNLPEEYSQLHNKYKNQRSLARYLKGDVCIDNDSAQIDVSTLGDYRMYVAGKVK